MARAQSQFLRIYGDDGITYHRWQNYYGNSAAQLEGAAWTYLPFLARGFTAGAPSDEAGVSISAPATTTITQAFELAIRRAWLANVRVFQFSTLSGDVAPQSGLTPVAEFTGQIIGAVGGLTTITLQLGSALSPVGVQVPPRVFTTAIMGRGAIL